MKIIFTISGLLLCLGLNAQTFSPEIISTAGGHYDNAAGKLSWTIGEPVIETFMDTTDMLTQGFHQPNCGSQGIAGEIIGCDLLCAGDLSHTYIYEVSTYPDLISYDWSISPVGVANIISSSATSIELEFPNIGITSCNLRFTPSDECGDGEPVNFEIALDTACVWPGDVNNDGIVDWGTDACALSEASTVFDESINTSPTPPIRPTSCITTDVRDWEAYPAIDWDDAFNFEVSAVVYNSKYADANGSGAIEVYSTPGFDGYSSNYDPLPANYTDMDAVAFYGNSANLTGGTHSGNSHYKQNPSNSIDIELVALDSVLEGGDELRLMVLVGNDTNVIENIHSIALKAGFSLGTYKNPVVRYGYSHLAPYPWLRFEADYPSSLKTDATDSEWWIAVGKRGTQAVTFSGEELCRLVCEVPIAGMVDSTSSTNKVNGISIDTVEVEITINEAAYIKYSTNLLPSSGTLQYLQSNTITVYIVNRPIIYIRALLAGSYDENTGLLDDGLRERGVLPLLEPYTALGYTHVSGGGETISPSVLSTTGDNAIVDWVMLELRDSSDLSNKVATRSCLIQRDGDIVDIDGVSPVKFIATPNGSYYLVVRHRNHLPIMSSVPVQIHRGQENGHDFSLAGSFYTTNTLGATEVAPNIWGMFSGDANESDSVDGTDRVVWSSQNGAFDQYLPADFNLDGNVDGIDRIIWGRYNGAYSNIPK